MKKLLNRLIQKLGKENYEVDEALTSVDIIIVLRLRFAQMFRGMLLKFKLKSSNGIIFKGKNCKIKHCRKIVVGKSLTIGDNVEINALSKFGVIIGDNVSILKNTIIECTGVIRELGEGLKIGNHVGIAQNCFIQVRGKVEIGNYVIFGPQVSIFSENHLFEDKNVPIMQQGARRKGVIIEDDVWLGTGVTILDGVVIGEGSVVAAGSVVNKNVEPYSIVAGIPAKLIKMR